MIPSPSSNWEKGKTQPPATAYPAILAFLGYDPTLKPGTLAERITAKRRAFGWSIREAARQLDVDPGVIGKWERGGTILCRTHRARVAELLGMPEAEITARMANAWGKAHIKSEASSATDG